MRRRALVVVVLQVTLAARAARAADQTVAQGDGASHARADGQSGEGGLLVALFVIGMLVPSDLGAVVTDVDRSDGTRFAIGWSWQVPLSPVHRLQWDFTHHYAIAGLDYLPVRGDVHVRGRFGYRCNWRHGFMGLAPAVDYTGWTWSPEAGVKFGHTDRPGKAGAGDLSLHLLVRANTAIDLAALRDVGIFLGWGAF